MFCFVGGDERRSSLQVRSVDEADKEPNISRWALNKSRSDIPVKKQCQETRQVAMQQLVEQIQQLSKSLSFKTSGSQQWPPPSCYSNHNGQCWNWKEFGHYCWNCLKCKSLDWANPGSHNASRVSPMGKGDSQMRVMLAPQLVLIWTMHSLSNCQSRQ